MPQEQVNFRATIIDATAHPVDDSVDYGLTSIDEIVDEVEENVEVEENTACCDRKVQTPRRIVETNANNGELADALPMILLGVGVAYLIGVCTGASIFSSGGYYVEPLIDR
jgi:hypothetical protein